MAPSTGKGRGKNNKDSELIKSVSLRHAVIFLRGVIPIRVTLFSRHSRTSNGPQHVEIEEKTGKEGFLLLKGVNFVCML